MGCRDISDINVFILRKTEDNFNVLSCGRLPLTRVNSSLPGRIKGIIKLNTETVPVIDLAVQFCDTNTRINDECCALIIEHTYAARTLHTAVLVGDIEDIITLTHQQLDMVVDSVPAVNITFILELIEALGCEHHLERQLNQNHLLINHAFA